jgi:hypothetical protein
MVQSFAPEEEPILDLKVLTDRAVAALPKGEAHEVPPRMRGILMSLGEDRGIIEL